MVALNSHGNYIADHGKSWKNHGIVFLNFCGNPENQCCTYVKIKHDFLSGNSPSTHEGGPHLPDGTDLRQVTVLSKTDWERIQQQLYRKQIEEERLQTMIREREERKAKSKEVVQHWGNTIAVSMMR